MWGLGHLKTREVSDSRVLVFGPTTIVLELGEKSPGTFQHLYVFTLPSTGGTPVNGFCSKTTPADDFCDIRISLLVCWSHFSMTQAN
jgi:hypothetical protein